MACRAYDAVCSRSYSALWKALDDPDADAMMNYRGCHGSPKRTSRTPLLQAAANGDVKSVDILLVNGADANEREPQTGMTALHLSTTCRGGNTSIINSLIKDGHANPALRDKQGRTAEDIAVQQNRWHIRGCFELSPRVTGKVEFETPDAYADGQPSKVSQERYVEVGTMPESPDCAEPGRMKLRAYMVSDRIPGKVLDFEVLLDGCGMTCKGDSRGYRDSEYSLNIPDDSRHLPLRQVVITGPTMSHGQRFLMMHLKRAVGAEDCLPDMSRIINRFCFTAEHGRDDQHDQPPAAPSPRMQVPEVAVGQSVDYVPEGQAFSRPAKVVKTRVEDNNVVHDIEVDGAPDQPSVNARRLFRQPSLIPGPEAAPGPVMCVGCNALQAEWGFYHTHGAQRSLCITHCKPCADAFEKAGVRECVRCREAVILNPTRKTSSI